MHSHIFLPTSLYLPRLVKFLSLAAVTAMALSLGSCGSSKQTSKIATHRPSKPASVKDIDIASMTKAEKSLVKEATAWLGTPYKYGGNTRSGVDCSGFVYHVFRNSLDINLPRNSGKQHDYCRKVSKKDLTTGDLVFFATTRGSKKVSHVGLYVGDGKMIHASTSRGVVCQNLSDDYYTRTFVYAGRVESFASINKAKKTKSSKPEKTKKPKEKPQTPKPSTPKPVETTPVTIPTVHIDEIDSVLQPEQSSPSVTQPVPQPVSEPEIKSAQPEPVRVEEPQPVPEQPSAPTSVTPVNEPLIPVRTAEPAPQPSPDDADEEGGADARSAVLRNLPDLQ